MNRIFILTFGLLSLVSCIPSANVVDGDGQCSADEQYNAISRQCEQQVNQAPVGTLNSEQIYEDSGTNTIVLTYYDVDNEPATACQILTYGEGLNETPPSPCSCTSGVCSVPVTPNSNYYGTTYFSYRVIDTDGYSAAQTVSVVVNSVNDAPVAATIDPIEVDENVPSISGTIESAADNDVGDTLSYSLLSSAVHGQISLFPHGYYEYEPDDNATDHGQDVETLYYRVCDNGTPVLCGTGVLRFAVQAVNDAPITDPSNYLPEQIIDEDTSLIISAPVGTDREGDAVYYVKNTNPSHGTLSVPCFDNVAAPTGSRSCTYTPAADYNGTDFFTYKLCNDSDASGDIDTSLDDCSSAITISIKIEPVNDAPRVDAILPITTDEDVDIVDSPIVVTDVDSTALTYSLVTDGTYGSVTFNSSNQFTYDVNDDVNNDSIWIDSGNTKNNDSFTFKVCDDQGACSADQSVTINITPQPDAPTITMTGDYAGITTPTVVMNEGGSFNLLGIKIDEGGASDEDDQELKVEVSVSQHPDAGSIDPTLIMPVVSTDNSHLDVQYQSVSLGVPGSYPLAGNYIDVGDGVASADAQDLDLILTPVGGEAGTVVVTISACQYEAPAVTCAVADVSQVFYFQVNSVTAIHGGWKHIKAIGAKRNKAGTVVSYARDDDGAIIMDGVNPTFRNGPRVELEWNAMVIAGTANPNVTISGWQIFRRLSGENYNWDEPVGEITTASVRKYVDTNFSDPVFWNGSIFKSTVLYYTVRPVDSDDGLPVPTAEVFSEVRVIAPPDNMVFVHRWMVNQEVCGKMHLNLSNSGVDTVNSFRCLFSGPGSTDVAGVDYYDIGQDLLVDISEAGCPYDTVGVGNPNTNGVSGSSGYVYYDRSAGDCYIYDDDNAVSSEWDKFSGDDAADTIEDELIGNSVVADSSRTVYLPPLVNVTAANASFICQQRSGLTIEGLSAASSSPLLPSRKQQMAYASWSDDLSDVLTNEYEEGLSLGTTSKCNSSSANGVEDGYSDATMPGGSYFYTLPGSETSSIRSIYTGSEELGAFELTPACVSRYGAQDVYGNVAEWVSDQMGCGVLGAPGATYQCEGISRVGPNNPGATDWLTSDAVSYAFDNSSGVCADGNGDGDCDDATDDTFLVGWYLNDMTYNATQFSFPMGLPYYGSYAGADTLIPIGNSSLGITATELRNDYVTIYAENLEQETFGRAGIATGGSYLSGSKAGRYSLEFVPKTQVGAVDAEYNYSLESYPGANQGIFFNADDGGVAGSEINITIENSGSLDAAVDDPTILVVGTTIVIDADTTLFTGHTTADIIAAINSDPDASVLIDATNDVGHPVLGPNAANDYGGKAFLYREGVTYVAKQSGIDGMGIKITFEDTATAGAEVATLTDLRSITISMEDGVSTAGEICQAIKNNTDITTYYLDCTATVGYRDGVEYTMRGANPTGVSVTLADVAPNAITSAVDAAAVTVDLEITVSSEVSENLAALFVPAASSVVAATAITNGVVQAAGTIDLTAGVAREILSRGNVNYQTTSLVAGGKQVLITINTGKLADDITVDPVALTVVINLLTEDTDTVVSLINGLSGADDIIDATIVASVAQGADAFTVDADYVDLTGDATVNTVPVGGSFNLTGDQTGAAGYFTVLPSATMTLSGGIDSADSKREDIGFRCVIPISNSEYSDADHKAGYTYD